MLSGMVCSLFLSIIDDVSFSVNLRLFLVDVKISEVLQKLTSDVVVLETSAQVLPRSITHTCEKLLLLLWTFGT